MIEYTNNKFTLADIKNGDVCIFRDNSAGIAIPNLKMIVEPDCFYTFEVFNDDLTSKGADICDIITVYRPQCDYQCSFKKTNFTQAIKVFDKTFDRQKWIYDMYKLAFYDNTIDYFSCGQKLVLICDKNNINKYSVGVAKQDGNFYYMASVAVAYAKYKGIKIPEEI